MSQQMKIANEAKGLMQLIQRSPDIGDGWRNVSEPLAKSVLLWAEKSPELFEIQQEQGLRVRLSERGLVLADYV